MAINFTNGVIDTINADGVDVLRLPNNYEFADWPAFHARRDNGHVSGGNQIIFDNTTYNNGGHYSTNSGYFTAPIDGTYWFHVWTMDTSGGTQYTNDYIELQRNNSNSDANELRIYTSSDGAYRSHRAGGWIRRLNGGDNMRVYNQNAAVYATSNAYCYFCGCLLAV